MSNVIRGPWPAPARLPELARPGLPPGTSRTERVSFQYLPGQSQPRFLRPGEWADYGIVVIDVLCGDKPEVRQ